MTATRRTIGESLAAATARLEAAGLPGAEARQSAWVLAAHALRVDRAGLLARLREPAQADFEAAFDPRVARRAAREPVAYITGEREFYGRPFAVTRDVLIPRPETELVIEEALKDIGHPMSFSVADVGTGSGCLAITLALECLPARVIATDTSKAALDVARVNVCRADGATRADGAGRADRLSAASRIEFRLGAYLAGCAGPFDLIVSNPPYVREADRPTLAPEVVDFEPGGALFAGADGLDVIRVLVPAAAQVLAPGGRLVMEIGSGQADEVRRIVADAGLVCNRIRQDLQHIPRVVVARAPGGSS